MSELGEYWRDVKQHYRNKKKQQQVKKLPAYSFLRRHPDCKEVGDHHRIGEEWDFWHTCTVRNIKTGENITLTKLAQMFGY